MITHYLTSKISMSSQQTPAQVLRKAWSVFRLSELQAAVSAALVELEKLEPHEVLGRDLSHLEVDHVRVPIDQALQACRQELHCESGLPGAEASAIPDAVDRSATCQATFEEALGQYRRRAAHLLELSFGGRPTTPDAPAP